jgi:hypothetical protein
MDYNSGGVGVSSHNDSNFVKISITNAIGYLHTQVLFDN